MATTTTITPPKQFVAIGSALVGGSSVEVLPSPEFVRFLFDVVRRIGGAGSSMSVDGLVEAITRAELDIDALQLDVEAEQIKPIPEQPMQAVESVDGRVASLEAEIAVLRSQIDGILQR